MTYEMKRLDGGTQELDEGTVDAFARSLDGTLVTPASQDYDEVRAIWNAMIDRRPGLIASCTSEEDVRRAVRFAVEHDLLVSVRGGGHNIAGSALADGALLIDLSPMKDVKVDAQTGRTRVQPGATLAEVDTATKAHGLAVPVGINSTTGFAGLALGGGFGWLSRKHGLTVDSMLSARVVTADGEAITASADEHEDLFWALRGGGGNFGIVSQFELQAHPTGPELLCGLVIHPGSEARTVLEHYREFCKTAPDDLTVWVVLRKAPPLPFLDAAWHGKDVLVLAMVYAGDPAQGEKATAGIRSFGNPIADVVAPSPFAQFQTAFDPLLTPGARNYWKSHNLAAIEDGLLELLIAGAAGLPSAESEIFVAQLGGAMSRVPADATAYVGRDAAYIINVHTRWQDAADDERCMTWARGFFQDTAPFATGGVYVNFMPGDEAGRVAKAYGPNWDRLRRVKAAYDPANRFRTNQNIPPATNGAGGS